MGYWELGASNPTRHGYGVQLYDNGSLYEGYWVENQKSGKGRVIYNNLDTYEGMWKDNKYDGKGEY